MIHNFCFKIYFLNVLLYHEGISNILEAIPVSISIIFYIYYYMCDV